MKDPTKASRNSRTTHKAKNGSMDGKLTSYYATVSHFRKTDAMDYIISAAQNNLFKFLQPYRISKEEYAAVLQNNSLLCVFFYPE